MSKIIEWLKHWGTHSIFWMTYNVVFSMFTASMATWNFHDGSSWFVPQVILCTFFLFMFAAECRGWAIRFHTDPYYILPEHDYDKEYPCIFKGEK